MDLFATVNGSGILRVLATDNYAEGLTTGDDFVLRQVLAMKQDTRKPMIILWHKITEDNKELVKRTFSDFQTFCFDYDGLKTPEGFKETLFKLAGKKLG